MFAHLPLLILAMDMTAYEAGTGALPFHHESILLL